MASEITNYKCPACTGPLHFLGSTGKLECDYCGSSFDVNEIEDLYASANEKAEAATEKEKSKNADEWEVTSSAWNEDGMVSYNCPSCGAELICEETTAASSCPYCGNPTVVPGQFAGGLKPDYVIPFKLDKDTAVEALKRHYKGKMLLPKSFTAGNHIEEIKGVYVPFWLYDGETTGTVNFEATIKSTVRLGKEEITKTEYYDVVRSGSLKFKNIPADASKKMPDDLMDSIEPYDYSEMKGFSKAYLTGFIADKYDVSHEENADRIKERAENSTKNLFRSTVTGYTSVSDKRDDLTVQQGKISYAMLPVWLLNTKWKDQNYFFAMNGQTGKLVGDLPVDVSKALAYFLLYFVCASGLSALFLDFGFIAALITGLVVGGVALAFMYGSMKSVHHATEADSYVERESLNLLVKKDVYIRTEESRRKISDD